MCLLDILNHYFILFYFNSNVLRSKILHVSQCVFFLGFLSSMIHTFLNHGYYSKMLELQEKLRKSEVERILLEKKFCLMKQESRWRYEACMNKLQMHYIKFLEEQRVRDERNYKLLSTLDRVDESLAHMTVKTDRICILKKDYEASLMRIRTNRHQALTVTGDSGVCSQNEHKQLRQNIRDLSNLTARSRYNIERRFYNVAASLDHNEPFFQDRLSHTTNYGKTNQVSLSSRKLQNHSWTGKYSKNNSNSKSIKVAHNNFFIKALINELRSQHLEHLENTARAPEYTNFLGTLSNFGDERVNGIIENELERHIHKIRNLHDSNNPYSLEEIEQNTSGDILNVTLSDDNVDHLPVEENIKKGKISTELKVIPAIANGLISKNVNDIHVKNDISHVVVGKSMEKMGSDMNIGQETSSEVIAGNEVTLANSTVNNSVMHSVISTPIQNLVDENEFNNDVAMCAIKINPLVENIETIRKSSSIADSTSTNFFQLSIDEVKFQNEQEIFANSIDSSEIINLNESYGQQQEVCNNDNNIEYVENSESQNPMNAVLITESQVIPVNKTANSIDETSLCQTNASYIDTVGKNCDEKNQNENIIKTDGIDNAIAMQRLIQSNDNRETYNETNETIYNGSEKNYESSHAKQIEVSDNQDLQLYPQTSNQVHEYNDDQYQHDPNQQYQYSSNKQYEQYTNEEYQYEEKDSQYIEDSNDQFQHQQYAENNGQQYAINLNEQYHEYSVEQNQQYDSNAYIGNSNVAYDSSLMYAYPTQEQSYMAENTYDESQTPASDQQHQDYQEQFLHYENSSHINNETMMNYHIKNLSNNLVDNDVKEHYENELSEEVKIIPESEHSVRIAKDVIESILDSDTESTVEKNISNTDSDFNFN